MIGRQSFIEVGNIQLPVWEAKRKDEEEEKEESWNGIYYVA